MILYEDKVPTVTWSEGPVKYKTFILGRRPYDNKCRTRPRVLIPSQHIANIL